MSFANQLLVRLGVKESSSEAAAAKARGYNYAAGLLLCSDCKESTILELEAAADNPFDKTAFDYGIEQAVRDWLTQFPEKET